VERRNVHMFFLQIFLLHVVFVKTSSNKEKVADFTPPSPLPPWIYPGSEIAIRRKAFNTDVFDRVAEDEYCVGGERLGRWTGLSLLNCRDKCYYSKSCSHFAFWSERGKKCETYSSCPNLTTDGKKKIQLFFRATTCEVATMPGSSQNGYMAVVQSFFPPGVVSHEFPNRNMQCSCVTDIWMICAIFVNTSSENNREKYIVKEVMKKLQRDDLEALDPFYIMPSNLRHLTSPIMHRAQSSQNRDVINAEFEVLPTNRCALVDICIAGTPGGVCPILGTLLDSRQPIYILKSDEAQMKAGKPVPCISVAGMRFFMFEDTDNLGIIDVFGRENGRRLFAEEDYVIYWIFDEDDLLEGICQDGPILPKVRKRRGGGKKKKASESEAGPSDIAEAPNSPESAGPSSAEAGPSSAETMGDDLVSERSQISPAEPLLPFQVPSTKIERKNPGFSEDMARALPNLSPPIQEQPPKSGQHKSVSSELQRDSSASGSVSGIDEWIQIGKGGRKAKQAKSAKTSADLPTPTNQSADLKEISQETRNSGPPMVEKLFKKSNLNPNAPEWFPQRLNPGPPAFFPMEPNMFADGTRFYSTFYNARTATPLYEPRMSTPPQSAKKYVSQSDVPLLDPPEKQIHTSMTSQQEETIFSFHFYIILFTICTFVLTSSCLQKRQTFDNENPYVEL